MSESKFNELSDYLVALEKAINYKNKKEILALYKEAEYFDFENEHSSWFEEYDRLIDLGNDVLYV